jgi:ribokinase
MLKTAREMGKLIATDVHSLSDLENDYDRDFMEAADILFMSDELLPVPAEEFAREVMARYHPKVLVIGMGSKGAHLSVRDENYAELMPVVSVRSIVSTIGAGDALFSSFIHGYLHSLDAVTSLRKAMLFAGYKIGVRSAAEGFLSSQRLDEMYHQHYALED